MPAIYAQKGNEPFPLPCPEDELGSSPFFLPITIVLKGLEVSIK